LQKEKYFISPAFTISSFLGVMFKHESSLRVRYAETDRMGYVYYGNYATYFEVGRVETMRTLGIPYRMLEDQGILLPVAEYSVKYLKPAFYDDELIIVTTIPAMPSTRIKFEYEAYRADTLLCKGTTDLVFVDQKTGRPIRLPEMVAQAMKPYFPQ
jgi:acyl-CoA thioester hydrolase